MTATIQFNAAAKEMLEGRSGGKLRMEIRDGTMFVRPTDRKAGPHVLSEYVPHGKTGIAVNIDEKQLEKLSGGNLQDKSQFNVVKDKYGWFALRTDGEGNATATVSMKARAGKGDGDNGGSDAE